MYYLYSVCILAYFVALHLKYFRYDDNSTWELLATFCLWFGILGILAEILDDTPLDLNKLVAIIATAGAVAHLSIALRYFEDS